MRYKLTSVDGLLTFELRDGARLVVGRAPKSDIPIIDPTISRRHAELESSETGFTIRDLGSSNGTFVNGARIESGTATTGDLVAFGKVGFRLQRAGADTDVPPAEPEIPTPPSTPAIRR